MTCENWKCLYFTYKSQIFQFWHVIFMIPFEVPGMKALRYVKYETRGLSYDSISSRRSQNVTINYINGALSIFKWKPRYLWYTFLNFGSLTPMSNKPPMGHWESTKNVKFWWFYEILINDLNFTLLQLLVKKNTYAVVCFGSMLGMAWYVQQD